MKHNWTDRSQGQLRSQIEIHSLKLIRHFITLIRWRTQKMMKTSLHTILPTWLVTNPTFQDKIWIIHEYLLGWLINQNISRKMKKVSRFKNNHTKTQNSYTTISNNSLRRELISLPLIEGKTSMQVLFSILKLKWSLWRRSYLFSIRKRSFPTRLNQVSQAKATCLMWILGTTVCTHLVRFNHTLKKKRKVLTIIKQILKPQRLQLAHRSNLTESLRIEFKSCLQ